MKFLIVSLAARPTAREPTPKEVTSEVTLKPSLSRTAIRAMRTMKTLMTLEIIE